MLTTGYSNGPVRLYYELHGDPSETPVLLLIHGGGSTIATNWDAALPTLSARSQVLAVELQGHGHTAAADRPARFETSADDVALLLGELALGPVDVLGFSNGGQVALTLAMRHPDAVRRLIAASTPVLRDGMPLGFWEGMAGAALDSMPGTYHRADLEATGGDRDHLRRMFEADVDLMVNGFQDFTAAELGGITSPALIVAADQDVPTLESVVWAVETIPGARLLVVPGNHGDYLGERLASAGDLTAMSRSLPWLIAFLDES